MGITGLLRALQPAMTPIDVSEKYHGKEITAAIGKDLQTRAGAAQNET